MNIYLISGLGADKRVFSKLVFSASHVIKHIEWISPISNEDLSSYAIRLSKQINEAEPFCLVGVSFGGMIAVELNKFMRPLQTIVISSASTNAQIPWYYKIVGRLKIYTLVPVKILKAPTALTFWFFGTKTEEEKFLLTQILKDTDGRFLKWAISKITNWDQKIMLKGIYQVHGTADRIFPAAFIKADLEVRNGSHLMVYSKNEIITSILAERLG
jgi:hypothetical protein